VRNAQASTTRVRHEDSDVQAFKRIKHLARESQQDTRHSQWHLGEFAPTCHTVSLCTGVYSDELEATDRGLAAFQTGIDIGKPRAHALGMRYSMKVCSDVELELFKCQGAAGLKVKLHFQRADFGVQYIGIAEAQVSVYVEVMRFSWFAGFFYPIGR
jgi:hypothetical protein